MAAFQAANDALQAELEQGRLHAGSLTSLLHEADSLPDTAKTAKTQPRHSPAAANISLDTARPQPTSGHVSESA